ncbi:lipopolysaccharide biosynthesis protein [Bradyrhizobium sp. UFLA05-112]
MLRRFLHNTAISAVAYALAGVLGLFAVGLIVKSYGVTILGLTVLLRGFLPIGFLAMIDFGVSETTTQMVARGRIGDWKVASEKFTIVTLIAGTTGIASAVVLWFVADGLAVLFRVAPEHLGGFVMALKLTSIVVPVAFVGLVAEGALKGFEQYAWLRLTEVGGSILYVASIYVCVWQHAPYEWLVYSFLATVLAKYIILAVATYLLTRDVGLRFSWWSRSSRDDVLYRSWLMFNSRIAAAAQQTLMPLAVGALYGPVGVGTFDVLTRLPRFLKTTMSPLYSAILPIAAHIEERTDVRRGQMLARNGLVLPAAIIIPVLVVVALFSRDILRLWIGAQYSDEWLWLAISLAVPATTVMLGPGQTALMVRSDFLRISTRLLYFQVVTQYVITGVLLLLLRERAFVLGWAVSYVVFAPILAHLQLTFMELSPALFWEQVARQIVVALMLCILVLSSKMYWHPDTLTALVVVGSLGCIAAWTLSAALILSPTDRAMFGRFARTVTQR